MKISLIVLLVIISVPAIGLLFIQNKHIQTSISDYIANRYAEDMGTNIFLSSVKYSFFKRLYIYDLLIEDQLGDTLLYSEYTSLRFKKFKPDKLDIHLSSVVCENIYFNVVIDENRDNNVKFFTDWLKSPLPPEERIVLTIDRIETNNSHFSQTAALVKSPPYGIDFSDFDVQDVHVVVEDFIARMDTVFMTVAEASGVEKTGFVIEDVSYDWIIGLQFLTFLNGDLSTPLSTAHLPIVDFRFDDYLDFQEVYDSVDVNFSSENSYLAFSDLAYFFYQLEHLNGHIDLDGNVHGRFGYLVGDDIEISYQDSNQLDFDMELIGLPSEDSLYMNFDFKQFRSDMLTLKEITAYHDFALFRDSSIAEDIGNFNYFGQFSGYTTDFETSGWLNTELGSVQFNMNVKPDTSRSLKYKGSLETSGFRIGKFIDQEKYVGNVSLNLEVDGNRIGENIDLLVSGNIDSIGIYDYTYKNINLLGNISNKTYDGSFSIKDPNIDLNFTGRVDFEQEVPQMNFTVDVANLRPYYLNLRSDDPEYFASFFLKTDLTGITLDQLNGEVELVNSFFKSSESQVQIYDFLLSTQNTSDSSFVTLRSDVLDADIYGQYQLSHLPSTFRSIINNHIELFPTQETGVDSICSFDYLVRFKDANPVLNFFLPKYEVAEGSIIDGYYRPKGNSFDFALNGNLPYFQYMGFRFEELALNSAADTNQMSLTLKSNTLSSQGDLKIVQPLFNSTLINNTSSFDLTWNNAATPLYSGDLSAIGILSHDSLAQYSYRLTIDPSYFIYYDKPFYIPSSTVSFQPQLIKFDSLLIHGDEQFVLANGSYSNNDTDEINIVVNELNLGNLSKLNSTFELIVDGRMSGDATLKKQNNKPLFMSDLLVDSLYINNMLVGNTLLVANWKEERSELGINISAQHDTIKTIDVEGIIAPANGMIDFSAALDKIPLPIIQPYVPGIIEDIDGYCGADLSITGSISDPQISGSIAFDGSTFEVSETRADYSINDELRIYKNNIFFEDFRVGDVYNNSLAVNGNITSSNFRNFIVNLDLNADNFNFLNTSRNDNEQFYGDIFASATVSLRGPFEELEIGVTAKTERHTNLNLPLYNAAEIQTTDFITFRRSEEIEIIDPNHNVVPVQGITLDMDLEISSGANVQLIFDPKVGDIIEASGTGNLKIKIDESGTFSMFGDVHIQDGEYLFTLQNVINKKFRVESGGNIVWNGSPTDAIIDLDAIYELKAAPYNLSSSAETDEKLNKRIPVHCLLTLEGDLSNPRIQPKIVLPTAEPETRALLDNNIGTDEELMRQFISLLVINNFMSVNGFGTDPSDGIRSGGMAAGVTASELLSNQLSNLLSQISNDFDIGVNYRPGDLVSSDEVEVALSTQLFDDRIILSGNLDVGGNDRYSGTQNIVGDFDLEFKMTEKISLKAFNRANDDFRLRDALYTQGVGLQYRSEFDQLSDLFQRSRKKEDREENVPDDENDAMINEEE